MDLRRQRIENEWVILRQMAETNPACITVTERQHDEFLLILRETSAPIRRNEEIELVKEHVVRFSFTRFFPVVPIEAYLRCPAFHPNIHPSTGFVCLWSRFSMADTVVEALCQLQRILVYSLFSDSHNDVMQPEAVKWAMNTNRGIALPLSCTLLAKPPGWGEEREFPNRSLRHRLS